MKTVFWPILGVAVAVALLLFPPPISGRFAGALMDLCHGPLFAALAMSLSWSLQTSASHSPRWRAFLIWGLVSALGVATEILQHWSGRHPAWQDAFANSLGAAAGVLWMHSRAGFRQKIIFRGLATIFLLASQVFPLVDLIDAFEQQRQMPVLASFETPRELSRWTNQGCQIQRVRHHQTAGNWALEVEMDTSRYPGLELREVPPDWTAYRELALDVTLTSPESLTLIIKIYDEAHNQNPFDRFHHQAALTKGFNSLRISLRDVQSAPKNRLMDLSRMKVIQLFTIDPENPARIYLDNIRLVPKPSTDGRG